MTFFLNQNDTVPSLVTQISDINGTMNITSGTPIFYFRLRTRASGSGLMSGQGSVLSGISGLAQYSWATGDVASPGVYMGKWKVNYSGGFSQSFPVDGSFILFQIASDL